MNRDILESLGFEKELKRIENRQCPTCEKRINVNDFDDDKYLKEFLISGMCITCQDKIFGTEE